MVKVKKRISSDKGFTLVELIVVIAIIAILAVVSVVGYTKYMEDARRSNDVQLATQMTTILRTEAREEGIASSDIDAHTVRRLLNDSEEKFNLSPTSKNSGFFYITETDSIEVMKYKDAVELNPSSDFVTFKSPEELFGEGIILLTQDEIPVPFAVSFVRKMANSGSRVEAEYADVIKAIDKYEGSFFAKLSNQKLEGAVKTRVLKMLDYYSPSTTLFVNNTTWVTTATEASSITKIVFADGVTNLPTFNVSGLGGKTQVNEITLPNTLKTAEDRAIPGGTFSVKTINYSGKIRVLSGSQPFAGLLAVPTGLIDSKELKLVNYRGYIDASNIVSNTAKIDLTELNKILEKEGISVDSVRLVINYSFPSLSKVYIYTKDGLYAIATPALVPLN